MRSRLIASAALIVTGIGGLASTAALADLTVTAAAITDTARQGELLNLEFTVANTDGAARSGVVLTMIYPAGLNQLFESEFDGDCPSTSCNIGETVTWTIGSIAAGDVVVVDLPPVVATGTANGTVIPFDVVVTDDVVDTDTASATVTVDGTAKYDLALAENADPALAGSALTYTLNFGYREDAASVNNSLLANFEVNPDSQSISLTVTRATGFLQS